MHVADFFAGSFGGACGVIVGFPLDTVKVRIQTQQQFTGIWHCIKLTLTREGISGFFKGMALPLSTISITSSVVFGVYRNTWQCLTQIRGNENSKLDVFLSGLAGGVAQVSVMSPGDVVKVRLQCQTENRRYGQRNVKYQGALHCLITVAREERLSGLYKGASALALRDGPSFATYFLTYHTLSSKLTPDGQREPEWPVVLFSGGMAGIAGWCVATPMDVIKARLQMDGIGGQRKYRGIIHCVSETVRCEGPAIFFRTLMINCTRAFPVNMVVFAMYELSIRLLRSDSPLQSSG